MTKASLPKGHDGVDQHQFLTILLRKDALECFEAALLPRQLPSKQRSLSNALGSALARQAVFSCLVPTVRRNCPGSRLFALVPFRGVPWLT
jgi:hypothetical protein